MYCPHCGAQIPGNSKFCNSCGQAIVLESVEVPKKGIYFVPNADIQGPVVTKTSGVRPPLRKKAERERQELADEAQKKLDELERQREQYRQTSGAAPAENSPVNNYPAPAAANMQIPVKGEQKHPLTFNNTKAYKGFNFYQERETVFVFISPYNLAGTTNLIADTISCIGKVKEKDTFRGYVKGKIFFASLESPKLEFYIGQKEDKCVVRAVMKINKYIKTKDSYWDMFLTTLFALAPNADFGVKLCNSNPRVLAVNYLGSDTVLTTSSTTSGGTSLLGFLAGGALFGTPGAIVGGMSGTRRTNGVTKEAFGNRRLVRIIFHNGRVFEGEIKKNSRLYNEILTNL